MFATDYVDRAAAHHPDRIAVTDGEMALTYAEVHRLSFEIAYALVAAGAQRGAHIAILSPNNPLVPVCQYAIMRAGCVWVPANHRNPAADTALQFAKLDVDWLFYHSSMEDYLDSVADDLSGLTGRVPIDRAAGGMPALLDWAAAARPIALPEPQMDDVLLIAPTGGTSGSGIKGVMHTHRTLEVNIATYYAIHQFQKPVVHLVVAPLTHAAGVIHWGLVGQAATHVICPSTDPAVILELIERHGVTFVFLLPTLIYALLAHPDIARRDLSSLEYVVFGSAPMHPDRLREAVGAFGPVLCQAYGSTEALLVHTYLSREDVAAAVEDPALAHRLASAGREAPFSRVELMDEDGGLLPVGERGEIVLRSGSTMVGYYKDPERTRAACAHGWHHMGDVGWKDAEGFLYLVDRKNDVIISGGFNIYPGEVEQAILGHPAVRDCAVVGVPHDKWGEAVLAALELKDDVAFDEAEFIAFCKVRLGSVRAPKLIEVHNELPRSPVGKTLRRVVRERHWQGRDRSI